MLFIHRRQSRASVVYIVVVDPPFSEGWIAKRAGGVF